MPTAEITADGVVPPLGANEILRHGRCGLEWTAWDDTAELFDPDFDRPRCPLCADDGYEQGFGGFQRITAQQSVASRWPSGVTDHGFTALPNLLLENMKPLGLDPVDLSLLGLYEQYRRHSDGAVWPSLTTIALRAGIDKSNVARRRGQWVRRGLCTLTQQRNANGTRKPSALRRTGLNTALAHIAANRRAGRPDDYDLAELLTELQRRAGASSGQRRAGASSLATQSSSSTDDNGALAQRQRRAGAPGNGALAHHKQEQVEEEQLNKTRYRRRIADRDDLAEREQVGQAHAPPATDQRDHELRAVDLGISPYDDITVAELRRDRAG